MEICSNSHLLLRRVIPSIDPLYCHRHPAVRFFDQRIDLRNKCFHLRSGVDDLVENRQVLREFQNRRLIEPVVCADPFDAAKDRCPRDPFRTGEQMYPKTRPTKPPDPDKDLSCHELRRFHNKKMKERAPSNRIASGIKKLYINLLDAV